MKNKFVNEKLIWLYLEVINIYIYFNICFKEILFLGIFFKVIIKIYKDLVKKLCVLRRLKSRKNLIFNIRELNG